LNKQIYTTPSKSQLIVVSVWTKGPNSPTNLIETTDAVWMSFIVL